MELPVPAVWVRVKNQHNHDNSLLESAVKKIVKEKTEDAVKNRNISSRTLFQVIHTIENADKTFN